MKYENIEEYLKTANLAEISLTTALDNVKEVISSLCMIDAGELHFENNLVVELNVAIATASEAVTHLKNLKKTGKFVRVA